MAADWESEKDIFYDALALAGEERNVFLEKACRGDTQLREEIERLLAYHVRGREYFFQLEDQLGAADRLADPLFAAGEMVSHRFEIQQFLARGGSAEVYAAFDCELEDTVALKILHGASAGTEAMERFKTEVRLSRKIQNQHVCRVHDAGRFQREGVPVLFFSMELLEGETLAQHVRQNGALPRQEVLAYLRQIANGLDAAHGIGVLHRDLKCANVMLVPQPDGSRKAVLTDFGLAVSQEDAKGERLPSGTPAYMAPEQVARGETGPEADIYALGVIAYEMVTGHLPFPGETPMEQAQARLCQDPTPPTVYKPGLSRAWEKAILRCLRRDPLGRFACGGEFVRALDPALRRNKGVALSIAAAVTLTAGMWLNEWRGGGNTGGPLVVLPFARAGDAEAWQAEALSDDLSSELGSVPGVRVIASSTAHRLEGDVADPAALRREFHVATVLSGSVTGAGGHLRIGVQLVDAGSGLLLWSHAFDATAQDLPHVEETIVLASVNAMRLRLPAPQVNKIRNRHSQVFAAYRAYSLGEYWMNRRTTPSLQEAIRNFDEATKQDASYALAYARLATAYNLISSRGAMPREEAFRRSGEAVRKALDLGPDLPEALLIEGSNLQMNAWDWDGAERSFRRCAELAPGLSMAHQWLAGLLSARGRHAEAIAAATQARDLDPLSAPVAVAYGALLFRAGRTSEALSQLEWVVKSEPAFLNAKLLLAEVYSYVERNPEAIQLLEAAAAADGRASYILGDLGHHLARAGRTDEARAIARELEERFATGGARASEIAEIYNGLGEADQACEWLERGVLLRDVGVTAIKVDPAWQSLREFPRFRSLVEKLKL
ncbi:MAG: protein kinase [Paludibaculum sp.]